MKVILTALNAKYVHSNLAVRSLKAFTRDLNYECVIKEFSINDRRERILEEILLEAPDIVAFSCYIWNIELVLQLANLIKTVKGSIEILYGGPEISYESEVFLLHNPGEYVIEGEGEETYREFIEHKLSKRGMKSIKGLYIKMEDVEGVKTPGIYYAGKREPMDINKTNFAYEEGENLENRIVYYEASRGCPFKCKYCLSSTTHGVRFIDISRVKEELLYFIKKKVRLVKFVDRTFNCRGEYAREIWSFLIREEGDTSFHFEISADLLSDKDLELLSSAPAGRFQFEIGVQSTNKDTLMNINRFADFSAIKERVSQLRNLGNIKQHLDLIAGLPGENYESFRRSFDDVFSLQPEEIQLGFLKVLKGSLIRKEAEKWEIAYSPYPPYEVLKSADLSYEELAVLKRTEEMIDKYYNSGKFGTVLKYFLKLYESPFDFFEALGQFFHDRGLFKRNISGVEYYKVFLDFNDNFTKGDDIVLNDLVKYDYLKHNKKKWLPEFLHREVNKREESEVKRRVEAALGKINESTMHIEKFRINIDKFLESGDFVPGVQYYLFDDRYRERIINVSQEL